MNDPYMLAAYVITEYRRMTASARDARRLDDDLLTDLSSRLERPATRTALGSRLTALLAALAGALLIAAFGAVLL